jgi:hypothetical protein
VLESTRRTIGLALPLLSLAFLAYAYWGSALPDWLFPHRGYPVDRIVAQTFLHTQGVFGVALSVMFTYVFLFVSSARAPATGATKFIIERPSGCSAQTPGGPAKVAVISSGLMGSLSGSAVANTAATGTFTIPMMRSAGFSRRDGGGHRGGRELRRRARAAGHGGGRLHDARDRAAAGHLPRDHARGDRAPALFYLSLFLIVHFRASAPSAAPDTRAAGDPPDERLWFEGVVFATALAASCSCCFAGYTAFRAVSPRAPGDGGGSFLHPRTRLSARRVAAPC